MLPDEAMSWDAQAYSWEPQSLQATRVDGDLSGGAATDADAVQPGSWREAPR